MLAPANPDDNRVYCSLLGVISNSGVSENAENIKEK